MGIQQYLNDAYHGMEDRWYKGLDWLDGHGIPVYAAIDPIDAIVPSFILFIVLLLVLLLLVFGGIFGSINLFPVSPTLSVLVTDSEAQPIENASVGITIADNLRELKTTAEGKVGPIEIPNGSAVKIRVSKDGFEDKTDSFSIESPVTQKEYALYAVTQTLHQILLKDKSNRPIKSPLNVNFQCTTPGVAPPASSTTITGLVTVTEPKNCGGLLASVSGDGFESLSSVPVTEAQQVIQLAELNDTHLAEATGSIMAELRFNNDLVQEPVEVQLFRSSAGIAGLGPLTTKTAVNGRVLFSDIPIGTYEIKSSATGQFSPAQSDEITVAQNNSSTAILNLTANLVGTVHLKIVNSANQLPVSNAQVTLRGGGTDAIATSDDNGLVSFGVSVDTTYQALIDHSSYCFKTASGLEINSSPTIISLKSAGLECNGQLRVRVIDQDNKPVQGALTGLFTEDGFATGFAKMTTDINGSAIFNRIPSGTYIAFGYKGYFAAKSTAVEFDARGGEITEILVVLRIESGILSVSASDDEGKPLQFAEVRFFNASNNQPISGGALPIEDMNGTLDFPVRADKRVYFSVEYEGLPRFVSRPYDILPNQTTLAKAVLSRERNVQGSVWLEDLGVYKDGDSVTVVSPGEKYTQRFLLHIPRAKEYDKVGIHLRAGNGASILEREKLSLGRLNAPLDHSEIRSTSFTPPTGYTNDLKNATENEALWINAEWPNPGTGTLELESEFTVKSNVQVEDALNFSYRAWGVTDGVFDRDPLDETLKTAESTSQLQALYANTRSKTLQSGAETVCDEHFCFSASLLDVTNNLVQNTTENFTASIFMPYKLNLTIMNAGHDDSPPFMGAEMQLDNEDAALELGDYSFNSAQGQITTGSVASGDSATVWAPAGDWKPGTNVSATLAFVPHQSGPSVVRVRVKSNQRIVFDKDLSIAISAAKKFSVLTEPSLLVSGVEQTLKVTVTDESSGAPVENAFVRIKDRFGMVLAEVKSSKLGVAELIVPAFAPATIFKVNVEKIEYEVFEKDLSVSDQVLEYEPDKLGIALNVKSKVEASEKLKITNKTGFDLLVKKFEFLDDRSGLLDLPRMNSALAAQAGGNLKAQDYMDLTLTGILSSAGKRIHQSTQVKGILRITVEAFLEEYVFDVPVTVSIGIGGDVDNPTCFSVSNRKWTDFTEGKPVSVEFDLKNNCSVDGQPITLENLEVSLEYTGNETGTFTLRGPASETVVRSGYYSRIANTIDPASTQHFVLTFAPDAGITGLTKAAIKFRAGNPTESTGNENGIQYLEDTLNAEITVNNLLDCVSVSPDLISIERDGTGSFNIETSSCGENTRISLRSRLTLTPNVVNLKNNAKQEVKVSVERNMPGQYPIYVYAKGDGAASDKLIKLVRIRIPAQGCIDIARYEFDIFDDSRNPFDGYDTTELYNNCYNKSVTANVKYDEHDMDAALHDGMGIGMLMGLMQGMNSSSQGCDFISGNCDPNRSGGLFGGSYKSTGRTEADPSWQITRYKTASGQTIYLNPKTGKYLAPQNGTYFELNYDPSEPTAGTNTTTSTTTPPAPPANVKTKAFTNLPVNVLMATSVPTLNVMTGFALLGANFQATPSSLGYQTNGNNPQGNPNYNFQNQQSYPAGTNPNMTNNNQAQGSLGSNMLGGIFGGKGFLSGALMGTLTGTFMSYQQQNEGEFTVNMVEPDVAIRKMELLMPGKLDQPSSTGTQGEVKGTTEIDKPAPVNIQGFSYTTPKQDQKSEGMFGGLLGGGKDEKKKKMTFSCPAAKQEIPGEGSGVDPQSDSGGLGGLGNIPGLGGNSAGSTTGIGINFGMGLPSLGDFMKLFSNGTDTTTATKDITMVDLHQTSIEPRTDNPALLKETRKIRFNNEGKLVQKDPANPFYRVLAVTADKYEYLKEYEFFKATDAKKAFEQNGSNLCVSTIAPVFQAFQLQFDSYRPTNVCETNPKDPSCGPLEIPNCQLGDKTGLTGASHAPKISLDWAFSSIGSDTCLADTANGVYCDATQFTISLLHRS